MTESNLKNPKEQFNNLLLKEIEDSKKILFSKNKRSTEAIGVVAKCLMVVEHFLLEHIHTFAPNLNLSETNLDFSKILKIAINIKDDSNLIYKISSQIWILNNIRKDLVHRLSTDLDDHPGLPQIDKFLKDYLFLKIETKYPESKIESLTFIIVTYIKFSKVLKTMSDNIKENREKIRDEYIAALEKLMTNS